MPFLHRWPPRTDGWGHPYDPEGNLAKKIEPDGRVWRYEWDGAGMLAKVLRPDGAEVTFSYDALGRRLSKTYRGRTTRWIWDGNVPLHEWVERAVDATDGGTDKPAQAEAAEYDGEKQLKALLEGRPATGPPSNGVLPIDEERAALAAQNGTAEAPITWLFEPESFAPLAKLVNGERYGIATDHLGTPRAMFDASGDEVWGADIDTYGDLRHVRGQRQACPFRWPGQYEDAETGLYYNRFRYYDREAGEYVSQDPIRLEGGLRTLGYVNDPGVLTDPLGLSSCVPNDSRVAAAIASGRPIVIVGRRMARVNPVADALRAKGGRVVTYNPRNFRSKPGRVDRRDVEANREWLRYWAKDKNAVIIDIGEGPGKVDPSPFYEVEKRSLYENWTGVDLVQFDPGF